MEMIVYNCPHCGQGEVVESEGDIPDNCPECGLNNGEFDRDEWDDSEAG